MKFRVEGELDLRTVEIKREGEMRPKVTKTTVSVRDET